MNMKKLFLLNLPYLLFVYPFDKLAQVFRLAPGADLSGKLLSVGGRLHNSPFLPMAQFPANGPSNRYSRCGGPSHGGLPERQKRQEIPPRNRVWFCPLGYGGGYCSLHGQGLFPKHPHDADGTDHNGEPSKAAEVCQK